MIPYHVSDISTNLEANNDAVTSNDVLLADDSSSSDDEQNDTKATTSLLKEKGLFFERPIILQDGLRDEFQGRQVISNLFNILEENKRIDVEEANKPPPAYYWTPGYHPFINLVANTCYVWCLSQKDLFCNPFQYIDNLLVGKCLGHEEKYSDLSAWGRVKHNLHWIGYKTFWGIAFAGEVAINILGLDQPEYHWMLQEAEKDKQKV